MAVTSGDDVDVMLATYPPVEFSKSSATTEGTGTKHSLWRVTGDPVAAAIPPTGGGEVPTKSTAGALQFDNASGGNTVYLCKLTVFCPTRGSLLLYDRLWHNSGLLGNVTTVQNVNSVALTRPDNTGAKTELYLEVYTAMGAAASTFTVSYTNQDGTAGRSATYVMPANALTVGQMVKFTLQDGDTGVRSIQSVQLSVSTGTAGNFGLVIIRRIEPIAMPAQLENTKDYAALGLKQIIDNACIAMMVLASAGFTDNIEGSYSIGQT